jgi:glycosyltransferase involved in cell wall biosynthesis
MVNTPSTTSLLVSIVIPAFNEGTIIESTLSAINDAMPRDETYEIIVVDDGSADDTANIAEKSGAKVVRHERNLGYGKALLTGLEQAKGEIVVTFDADLSYNPMDIQKLIKQADRADLVIGSRFLESSRRSEKIPFYKILWNKILALITYFLTGVRVTDHNSSFKAIRKDKLDLIHLTSSDFSINSEMVTKAARKGFDISEVAVLYRKWQRF